MIRWGLLLGPLDETAYAQRGEGQMLMRSKTGSRFQRSFWRPLMAHRDIFVSALRLLPEQSRDLVSGNGHGCPKGIEIDMINTLGAVYQTYEPF
jgi:hypothetical protein